MRSIFGATWRRPLIAPAVIPIGSGSTTRRRSCAAGKAATGSRSPAWPPSTPRRTRYRGCRGSSSEVLGAGTLDDVELARWIEPRSVPMDWPPAGVRGCARAACRAQPASSAQGQHGGSRRFGPSSSDRPGSMTELAVHGSRPTVHFEAFERLLRSGLGDLDRRMSRRS